MNLVFLGLVRWGWASQGRAWHRVCKMSPFIPLVPIIDSNNWTETETETETERVCNIQLNLLNENRVFWTCHRNWLARFTSARSRVQRANLIEKNKGYGTSTFIDENRGIRSNSHWPSFSLTTCVKFANWYDFVTVTKWKPGVLNVSSKSTSPLALAHRRMSREPLGPIKN